MLKKYIIFILSCTTTHTKEDIHLLEQKHPMNEVARGILPNIHLPVFNTVKDSIASSVRKLDQYIATYVNTTYKNIETKRILNELTFLVSQSQDPKNFYSNKITEKIRTYAAQQFMNLIGSDALSPLDYLIEYQTEPYILYNLPAYKQLTDYGCGFFAILNALITQEYLLGNQKNAKNFSLLLKTIGPELHDNNNNTAQEKYIREFSLKFKIPLPEDHIKNFFNNLIPSCNLPIATSQEMHSWLSSFISTQQYSYNQKTNFDMLTYFNVSIFKERVYTENNVYISKYNITQYENHTEYENPENKKELSKEAFYKLLTTIFKEKYEQGLPCIISLIMMTYQDIEDPIPHKFCLTIGQSPRDPNKKIYVVFDSTYVPKKRITSIFKEITNNIATYQK